MKKHTIRQSIRGALWVASFFGAFTILGDGWIKIIGVLSVMWMLGSTIATWIDESRDDA